MDNLPGIKEFVRSVSKSNRGWALDFRYSTRELVIRAQSGERLVITVPANISKHEILDWVGR